MGNALVANADELQTHLWTIQITSGNSISWAIGTVLTQYCVSEWIWTSRAKEHHGSPILVVSLVLLWALYSLLFNFQYGQQVLGLTDITKYQIVLPVLAIGGVFCNLLFSWLWYQVVRKRSIVVQDASETSSSLDNAYSSPLLPDVAGAEGNADLNKANDEEAAINGARVEASPLPRAKATVDYINNIKIFLTFMVIMYHCVTFVNAGTLDLFQDSGTGSWGYNLLLGWFFMMCRSYFMAAFFYYSGYFVPRSFDKKGRTSFLLERFKRLGIPFVVYCYIIGPYAQKGMESLLNGSHYPSTAFEYGPCWFLMALMQFSILYAIVCGDKWSPKVSCPSLPGLFAIGVIIGLLSGIMMLFTPAYATFISVVAFGSDFIQYLFFFFGGALAERNGWMEEIKNMSRPLIYAWAISVTVLYCTFTTLYNGSISFVVQQFVLGGIILKGIMGTGMFLAVTVFSMDYANKKFFCTPFFSKAMYTSYIIQLAFPVPFAIKCLLWILDAAGQVKYQPNPNGSPVPVVSNLSLIFPSWLFVCVVALSIAWPLGYAIRSIPWFSQVL